MVPQDLHDLIAAMGGAATATATLDTFFSQLNAGQDKPYAWLGNEPSLGTPWVYLSAGEPWRAQGIVRRALTTLYADTPDGLPGNDDLGTMSAWYVWCAMGLYPQNPSVRYLDLGTPLFGAVTLRAPGGPTVTIDAPRAVTEAAYVDSVRVNGRASDRAWITLPLRGSVQLDVSVGSSPNQQWGNADAAPPSFSTAALSLPPASSAAFNPALTNVSVAAGSGTSLRFQIFNGGTSAATVTWRALLPHGVHLEVASGRAVVNGGGRETVDTQISADGDLRAGYYAARIDGNAENGALLQHLAITVRVTNGSQRPALAFAENRFGNTITPIDLATLATGPEIRVGEEPRDAVLSSDGTRLYVANLGGGSISVVDTSAARVVATVKVGSSPNGIALTRDGKTLWVANSDDDTIEPIDTATLKAGATIDVGAHPRAIAIAPDDSRLYVSENGANALAVVDLRSRTVTGTIPAAERPSGLAITPDGKRLYVVNSASNNVTAVDLLSGGAVVTQIPVGVDPMEIAIAPNGRIAYVTNYANSTVTPIDLSTNTARAPIEVGGAPYGVAITSDGRTAVVISHRDNDATLIDIASGRTSRSIPLGNGPYTVAAP
jgi:YVTN family beta-propeller protein